MPQFILQSSFQFGEVSELMHAQVDSAVYYKAARRLRNVVVIPQGGVEKRFGTKYIGTASNVTDYTEIKAKWFDYSDGARYYVVFTNNQIDFYDDGTKVDTIVSTYSAAQIKNLHFAQTSTGLIVVHGSHAPAIITRTATGPAQFQIADYTFVHYPTYDFNQDYDTYTFHVYVTGGTTPITTAENLLGFEVDIVSSTAMFTTDDYIDGLFFGDSGVVRFTSRTNTTTMKGYIEVTFDNDSNLFHAGSTPGNTIQGDQAVITEKAFSATRGWPEKVAFYQNRIWFARTSTLLAGLWGSNYNGFSDEKLNFDDSEALDTNSVSTTLTGGDKAIIIKSMSAFKTLLITTSDGLFSTPLFTEQAITPSNVDFINKQTSDTSNEVPPLPFDNEIIFFDQGGRKIKNVSVSESGYNYDTNNLTILSPHIVNVPYSAEVYQNSDVKDGSWLFVINSAGDRDGQLSIYQFVREQSISAWTISNTSTGHRDVVSYFRHVNSLNEDVYFIVERTIDGNTVFYIEQLDWDLNTDCAYISTYGTPTTTITGLSHLEGERVTVLGDGSPLTDEDVSYTVTSGEIELNVAVTDVEVGLSFVPQVRPMPLNVPTRMGQSIYLPKTIDMVYVDYYQSVGITVNGTPIAPYQLSEYELDSAITPATEFAKFEPMGGWDPRQNIDISQNAPLGFTVIGVGYIVTVNG